MMHRELDVNIAKSMLNKAKMDLHLEKYSSSKDKTLIILGGQPGAGKSTIAKLVEDKYNNNIVTLNGDDYKSYYPGYHDLLKTNPNRTSEIVQPYSNFIVNELKKELMDKGCNLIIEGTMRNPDVAINTAKEFKSFGYKIDACIVSVNEHASRISCILRAEKELMLSGVGRTVDPSSHDEAYRNIPNTIKKLEESKLFDNITIYSRDGKIVTEFPKSENLAKSYEHNRNEIDAKLFKVVNSYIDEAKTLMVNRSATVSELTELSKIKEGLINNFMKYTPKYINSEHISKNALSKSPISLETKTDNKKINFER